MSTYKIVSDDYTINCGLVGNIYTGTFTINAANIVQNGNITTTGNSTISIPFLTVAANNTGAITDMGVLAQTGPTTFAGRRFDTTINAWQLSTSVDGSGSPIQAYSNIATGSTSAAGANTNIQFNDNNGFGGTGNLTFDNSTNTLTLQGPEVLGNIGTTPSIPTNAVAMYNNTIGSGGTGVYVLSTSVNDELVSKSKAIVYAIIF
jgi:hypothetical protein